MRQIILLPALPAITCGVPSFLRLNRNSAVEDFLAPSVNTRVLLTNTAEGLESRKPRPENHTAVWNVRTSSAFTRKEPWRCLKRVLWALKVGLGRHKEPHLQCHVPSSMRD
jgi:hypothetical protein